MKCVIFASVILLVSLGVDCASIQHKNELHKRMTRSLNELWTDNVTKATFAKAGEICKEKNMRLANPTSEEEDEAVSEFIKSTSAKNDQQHSYWVFGKYNTEDAPLIFTAWNGAKFTFLIESARSYEAAKKGGKDAFEAREELFICEKL